MASIRPSFMTKEQLDKYMSDLRQSRQPRSRANYTLPNKRFSLEFSESDTPIVPDETATEAPKPYNTASMGVRGSLRNREPKKSKNGWIVNSGWQIPRTQTEPMRPSKSSNLSENGPQADSMSNIQEPMAALSMSKSRDGFADDVKHIQQLPTPSPDVLDCNGNENFGSTLQPTIDVEEDEDDPGYLPESSVPAPLRITKTPSPIPTPIKPAVHSSQRPESVPQVIPNNRVGYSANAPPTPTSTPPNLEQRPKWEDRGVPTYAPVQPPTPPTRVIMMEDDEVVGEMLLDNPEADKGYNVQRLRNPDAPMPSEEVSKIAKAIGSRQDTASGRGALSPVPIISFDDFTSQRPNPVSRAQTTAPPQSERPSPVASQSWSGTNKPAQEKALPSPPAETADKVVPSWAKQSTLCIPGQNQNIRSHRQSDQPLPPNPTVPYNLGQKALPTPPSGGGYKGPIPVFSFDNDEDTAPAPPRRNPTLQPMPNIPQEYDQRPLPPVGNYNARPLPAVQGYDPRPLPPTQNFSSAPLANHGYDSRPLPPPQNFNAPPPAANFAYHGAISQPPPRSLPQYNIYQAPNISYGQSPQSHRDLPQPSPLQRQQTMPVYNAPPHHHPMPMQRQQTIPSYNSPAQSYMQSQGRSLPPPTPTANAQRPLPPQQNHSAPLPQIYSGGYQNQQPTSNMQQFNTHVTHPTNRIPRSSALCTGCNTPISSRAVSAQGLRFHPECFTCAHCYIKLEHVAFFPEPLPQDAPPNAKHSGRFYCHCDFHELFSPRCKSCKTPIEGEVVVALGASYHAGHFFCAECGDPFDSKSRFVEKDNYAWCVGCYQRRYSSKCKGCKRPVTDTVVKALDADWHVECFCCIECGSQFDDGRYFLRDGKQFEPVCVRCEETRLKGW